MIYLDNNSTTVVDPEVLQSMVPFFLNVYGNPSNIHNKAGIRAESAVEDALCNIADCFHANSVNDIVVTSGATEANNLAISGILKNTEKSRKHIIVSCIEHPSILEVCRQWEVQGVGCTYLPVGKDGMIDLEMLEKSIRPETCLISIMSANNEIGSIQPIDTISEIAKKYHILFHTDATQYLYYKMVNVQQIPANMVSFSAHKIHGPKGVGGLYMDAYARSIMQPLIFGGGQQHNIRSGTLNVPGIIGMSTAFKILKRSQDQVNEKILFLRKRFLQMLGSKCCYVINGSLEKRIPNNLNIQIPGVSAIALLAMLPELELSTGAACGGNRSSYVLKAIGLKEGQIRSSFRMGLSKYTTEEEIVSVADAMTCAIQKLESKNE